MLEHRGRIEAEIRRALAGRAPAADEVLRDLFAPSASPLQGYRRMTWVVGRIDTGIGVPIPRRPSRRPWPGGFGRRTPRPRSGSS